MHPRRKGVIQNTVAYRINKDTTVAVLPGETYIEGHRKFCKENGVKAPQMITHEQFISGEYDFPENITKAYIIDAAKLIERMTLLEVEGMTITSDIKSI